MMARKQIPDVDLSHKYLETARTALRIEIEGMQKLVQSLDGAFVAAIETIEEMKKSRRGRLIITGMGKSGHVGHKMAATFASTGTPSMFVHPGEASHGDLGMITDNDVVIALSKSGEAPELSDIIAYTRRFSIPLIAITADPASSLGAHADICLTLPKVDEACPNGLAPTTSTTLTMALGDALAVTLLKNMNLTPDQFRVFHPGGKLGRKLLKVTEVMDRLSDLPLVYEQQTMDQALLVMTEKNLGCVIVLREGTKDQVAGIITDGDLKRHMRGDLLSRKTVDIMTPGPKTIDDAALAAEAVDVMTTKFRQPITSLLVVSGDGALVGMIRLQACLQAGIV